jgi:transcriptional regulator with XRE-family HTH domain
MLKPEQIRGARAMLGLTQAALAEKAGISATALNNIERGSADPKASTLSGIQSALEAAGAIFVAENGDGPGVRLRKREDRKNLDRHIEHLEDEVAHLKPTTLGKPTPARGMAMLRRGRAKSDLAKAKNKRAKAAK